MAYGNGRLVTYTSFKRVGGFLLSGVVILAVVVAVIVGVVVLVDHSESEDESQFARLQQEANAACGTDRTRDVIWHPSGFAKRESFETHCLKANGEVYVVVTEG